MSNSSAAQLTVEVPQRGIWGTAGIDGMNIDRCGQARAAPKAIDGGGASLPCVSARLPTAPARGCLSAQEH